MVTPSFFLLIRKKFMEFWKSVFSVSINFFNFARFSFLQMKASHYNLIFLHIVIL
jgi:hypothetical protein